MINTPVASSRHPCSDPKSPIGIAVGHVDLVFDAIKGESNGLRRVRAIDVVLKTRQTLVAMALLSSPSVLDEKS